MLAIPSKIIYLTYTVKHLCDASLFLSVFVAISSHGILGDRANMTLPPVASSNRDPPAFDLTELGVRHFDEQGQAWHPYTQLQLGAQETISKVEHYSALSSCLTPIYIDIVTAF